MFTVIFICWCLWSLEGVFGSEFVSVSVMEGHSVLLSVNITETQRRDGIMWTYGTIPIAKLKTDNKYIYYNGTDGMFRDRLKLNETGSLIITDIRIKHSGLYNITTTREEKPLKIFNITVYTRLPVPVITNSSSLQGSSSSYCSVLCSVMNVSHVSLSWYKGKSLLSNISVSEHSNINISLHLECLDDSYTCVVNNPITNQTQHLNTDVCHRCPEQTFLDYIIHLSFAAGSLTIVILIFFACKKIRKTNQDEERKSYRFDTRRRRVDDDRISILKVNFNTCDKTGFLTAETDQAGEQEITYADPTFSRRSGKQTRCAVEDDVVYAGVMRT